MKKRPSRRACQKKTHRARVVPAPVSMNANLHREVIAGKRVFKPGILDKSVITLPLRDILKRDDAEPAKVHSVVIDLNLEDY